MLDNRLWLREHPSDHFYTQQIRQCTATSFLLQPIPVQPPKRHGPNYLLGKINSSMALQETETLADVSMATEGTQLTRVRDVRSIKNGSRI